MNDKQEMRMKHFLAWIKKNRLEYDKEVIEVREAENGNLTLFASKNLEEGNTLFRVYKSTILSTKTTAIANILSDHNVPERAGLALALMYETSLGERSPWFGYLQVLPGLNDLPAFWNAEEKEYLRGTGAEIMVEKEDTYIRRAYTNIILPLLNKHPYVFSPISDFSLSSFLHATLLVFSIAFLVDSYHGTALIPFADLLLSWTPPDIEEPQAHIGTERHVCEICGAWSRCDHTEELSEDGEGSEDSWEDEESEVTENSIIDGGWKVVIDEEDKVDLVELPDLEALEDAGVDIWADSDDDSDDSGQHSDLDVDADYLAFDSYNIIEFNLHLPVAKSVRILNVEGEQSNMYLLSRFGYALEDNPHDCVTVDETWVVDEFIQQMSAAGSLVEMEKVQERIEWFEKIKDKLGLETESDGESVGDTGEEGDDLNANHTEDEHTHTAFVDEFEDESPKSYKLTNDGLFEPLLIQLLSVMCVPDEYFGILSGDVDRAREFFERVTAATVTGDKNEHELGGKRKRGGDDIKFNKSTERSVRIHVWENLLRVLKRRLAWCDRPKGADEKDWNSWRLQSIEEDCEQRNRERATGHSRIDYALTSKINEKRILLRGLEKYEMLLQEAQRAKPVNGKGKSVKFADSNGGVGKKSRRDSS